MTEMENNGLSMADHRSLLRLERIANEILQQCKCLRHNAKQGHDDCLRFMVIHAQAVDAFKESRRAKKRYAKLRGWQEAAASKITNERGEYDTN